MAFFVNGTTMADLLRDVQVELRNIITSVPDWYRYLPHSADTVTN